MPYLHTVNYAILTYSQLCHIDIQSIMPYEGIIGLIGNDWNSNSIIL